MSKFREKRIEKLKDFYFQSSKDVFYGDASGETELHEDVQNPDTHLGILCSSIIAQLLMLSKTSLDQVSVGLEMIRHMHFFGQTIFPQFEDFKQEQALSSVINEMFCQLAMTDLNDCNKVAADHFNYVNDREDIEPSIRKDANLSARMLSREWERLGAIQDDINFLKHRGGQGQALFDEDEKPILTWQTPQLAVAALQQDTIHHMGVLADQSIEYAMTLLAKRQLIYKRLIPQRASVADELDSVAYDDYQKVGGLIERIDLLYEMRQDHLHTMNLRLA